MLQPGLLEPCAVKVARTVLRGGGLWRHILLTRHKMSEKHLARYIGEFAGKHNARTVDTIQQMAIMAQGMMGKRLPYQELITDP